MVVSCFQFGQNVIYLWQTIFNGGYTMKFSQIKYERVDLDGYNAESEELIRRLGEARSFAQLDALLAEDHELSVPVQSMRTVAQIRRDMDTRDAFYEEEVAFYDRELPKSSHLGQQWRQTLLESPFRRELEEKYGGVVLLNAEIGNRTFKPEIVEDLQKESELVSAYTKLIASAQIEFDGKMRNLAQMAPYKLSTDDDVRRAAWRAEGQWFKDHGRELDRIFDKLVALRDGMGRKLGHNGFTGLGYDRMRRNCYTEKDVEQFRIAVQNYVVPLCKRIYMEQARRMGFEFPMSFADKDLAFRTGNPRPAGGPADILAAADRFYAELSPETKEFWALMREQEMMDVESRPGKAAGGYCTEIPSVQMPFIFANFNGTAQDCRVITHEAGHAFAAWLNRDRIIGAMPSMEACEVHSMAMELFADQWAEHFYGSDAQKARYAHLAERLNLIAYGTMVDHFQNIVYEYPEFGPMERHMVWQELLGVYMPWVRPDDIPFYGEGHGWQRQSHIYRMPFYYIDYCLAQTAALQFWAMIREDLNKAWRTYLNYTRLGGSMVFTDLLASAGLRSPFDPECLKHIAGKVKEYLDTFDMEEIDG